MKSKIQKILNSAELAQIKKLNTPNKIQDFLDTLPFNFQKKSQTYFSPRRLLREQQAHCMEGALFAYLCLKYHNYESYILDLKVKKSAKDDFDHVIAIFAIKRGGKKTWGAISKTNHAVLRYRDPIYKSYDEIARSYFHEYFLDDGKKTLDSYSKPLDIFKHFKLSWIAAEQDLHNIALWIDSRAHIKFVPKEIQKMIRKVSNVEVKASSIPEWDSDHKML